MNHAPNPVNPAACTARSLQQLIRTFDLLITNGTIYDGNGGEPFQADIAVVNDRIVAIGALNGLAKQTIDAAGFAVAPGFINMLSWATESLQLLTDVVRATFVRA